MMMMIAMDKPTDKQTKERALPPNSSYSFTGSKPSFYLNLGAVGNSHRIGDGRRR